MSSENDEKTVKWYTFHSEKNGRDYYYEPITQVVTWIRPDSLHTHPVVPETPKEEILERRVSFHASVEEEKNVHMTEEQGEESQMSYSRRIPVLIVAIVLLCGLIIGASYMGWLPRGPLGSAFFGEESRQKTTSDTKTKVQHDQKHHSQPKIDRAPNRREKYADKKETPEAHVESATKTDRAHVETESWRPPIYLERKMLHHETKDTEESARKKEDTKEYRREERKPIQEKRRRGQPREADIRETSRHYMKESVPQASEKELPRKKGCLVPFAHVFSSYCRKMIAQKPVYDMDDLLDSLI